MLSQTTTITRKVAKLPSAFDVDRYRTLVPALDTNNIIYLNAGSRAPMNLKVRQAIDNHLNEAIYQLDPSPSWQASTEQTRALVGRYIDAPPESIAFTSDTTEGLNLFQRSLKLSKGDNVIILDTEHPTHAYGWLALRESGLEVRQVPTNSQLYANATTFASLVDENTKAIGISSIMFHSGQKNNVQDICNCFRPRGIHVLVDMTQEVGVGPISVTENGVSAACFSFHKALGCPKGLGALYIDPKIFNQLKQTPPIVGMGAIASLPPSLLASSGIIEYHQTTRRYEHLSLSIVSIQAAYAALTLLMDDMTPEGVEGHLQSLGKRLQEECHRLGIDIIGERELSKRAPHLYVLNLLAPAWKQHFAENSVYVSCYRLGVRVSFGFFNTEADVVGLAKVLEEGLASGIPLKTD